AARNTLLSRRLAGGSLKIVASRAPRNLRRHTARVLLVDEADAMDPGPGGPPILLAERRTLSFADRKIVLGSTPLKEETSNVLRSYAASDQRVVEVPCPECKAFTEILWQHIEWEPERAAMAGFRCPSCRALVTESAKPGMVGAGRWRATRSDVVGHAGFRLNALASLLANASWAKLAAEFLRAKDDSDELQVLPIQSSPKAGRMQPLTWMRWRWPAVWDPSASTPSRPRSWPLRWASTSRTIGSKRRWSDGRGATLEAAYFEQLTCERLIVRYQRGQPVRRFERIPGRRAEALDCL